MAGLSGFARSARVGRDDRGDVVLGWLTKIAVVLGLVGLCMFDVISIASTNVQVDDDGNYAARAASENWLETKSIQKAYDAAQVAATEQDTKATVETKGFRIDDDGRAHLRVTREATTLIVFRIGPIKHWAKVTRESTALDASS
jgi:hypothetical protein